MRHNEKLFEHQRQIAKDEASNRLRSEVRLKLAVHSIESFDRLLNSISEYKIRMNALDALGVRFLESLNRNDSLAQGHLDDFLNALQSAMEFEQNFDHWIRADAVGDSETYHALENMILRHKKATSQAKDLVLLTGSGERAQAKDVVEKVKEQIVANMKEDRETVELVHRRMRANIDELTQS